ncbi:MAG: ribonuclease G [Salinisphaera sp.]|nr:ribonuclease G [Salinisphaera sp.]
MSTEILVNVAPGETRVAQVENGSLQDVYLQRDSYASVAGNIYLGRVQRTLPGIQAAFVEVGLARTAFLHAADVVCGEGHEKPSDPNIHNLVHTGDTVLVQVIKEPLGSKGARLTMELSIPSRYLVLMPYSEQLAVSVRIEESEERERLIGLLADLKQETGIAGGFIVRTVGEGAQRDALLADMRFLERLWASIRAQVADLQAPALVHGDLPLATRMLRDLLSPAVERIRIDDQRAWEEMVSFAQQFVPDMGGRIERYQGDAPIFDLYGVEDEIDRSLGSQVPLKSGGSLVIEQTEAMTTVDVNTGAFVGAKRLEDTVLKTNLEAAQALVRQLRLRNLGGIIVVDFIDMDSEANRHQVWDALQQALEKDPAKSAIFPISALGLVEMTRKRTRESLEHLLCENCPTCGGRGSVKTPESVCLEVFRELLRSARQFSSDALLVLANPDVIAVLLDEQADALAAVSDAIGRPIRLQAESLYQQEQFDVVLM